VSLIDAVLRFTRLTPRVRGARPAQGALLEAEADFMATRELADAMGHFPTRLQARRGLIRLHLTPVGSIIFYHHERQP